MATTTNTSLCLPVPAQRTVSSNQPLNLFNIPLREWAILASVLSFLTLDIMYVLGGLALFLSVCEQTFSPSERRKWRLAIKIFIFVAVLSSVPMEGSTRMISSFRPTFEDLSRATPAYLFSLAHSMSRKARNRRKHAENGNPVLILKANHDYSAINSVVPLATFQANTMVEGVTIHLVASEVASTEMMSATLSASADYKVITSSSMWGVLVPAGICSTSVEKPVDAIYDPYLEVRTQYIPVNRSFSAGTSLYSIVNLEAVVDLAHLEVTYECITSSSNIAAPAPGVSRAMWNKIMHSVNGNMDVQQQFEYGAEDPLIHDQMLKNLAFMVSAPPDTQVPTSEPPPSIPPPPTTTPVPCKPSRTSESMKGKQKQFRPRTNDPKVTEAALTPTVPVSDPDHLRSCVGRLLLVLHGKNPVRASMAAALCAVGFDVKGRLCVLALSPSTKNDRMLEEMISPQSALHPADKANLARKDFTEGRCSLEDQDIDLVSKSALDRIQKRKKEIAPKNHSPLERPKTPEEEEASKIRRNNRKAVIDRLASSFLKDEVSSHLAFARWICTNQPCSKLVEGIAARLEWLSLSSPSLSQKKDVEVEFIPRLIAAYVDGVLDLSWKGLLANLKEDDPLSMSVKELKDRISPLLLESTPGYAHVLAEKHNKIMHTLNGNVKQVMSVEELTAPNSPADLPVATSQTIPYMSYAQSSASTASRAYTGWSCISATSMPVQVIDDLATPKTYHAATLRSPCVAMCSTWITDTNLASANIEYFDAYALTPTLTQGRSVLTTAMYDVFAKYLKQQQMVGLRPTSSGLVGSWLTSDLEILSVNMPVDLKFTPEDMMIRWVLCYYTSLLLHGPVSDTQPAGEVSMYDFNATYRDAVKGLHTIPVTTALGMDALDGSTLPYREGAGGTITFYESMAAVPDNIKNAAWMCPNAFVNLPVGRLGVAAGYYKFVAMITDFPHDFALPTRNVDTTGVELDYTNEFVPFTYRVVVPGVIDVHVICPRALYASPASNQAQANSNVQVIPTYGPEGPNANEDINVSFLNNYNAIPLSQYCHSWASRMTSSDWLPVLNVMMTRFATPQDLDFAITTVALAGPYFNVGQTRLTSYVAAANYYQSSGVGRERPNALSMTGWDPTADFPRTIPQGGRRIGAASAVLFNGIHTGLLKAQVAPIGYVQPAAVVDRLAIPIVLNMATALASAWQLLLYWSGVTSFLYTNLNNPAQVCQASVQSCNSLYTPYVTESGFMDPQVFSDSQAVARMVSSMIGWKIPVGTSQLYATQGWLPGTLATTNVRGVDTLFHPQVTQIHCSLVPDIWAQYWLVNLPKWFHPVGLIQPRSWRYVENDGNAVSNQFYAGGVQYASLPSATPSQNYTLDQLSWTRVSDSDIWNYRTLQLSALDYAANAIYIGVPAANTIMQSNYLRWQMVNSDTSALATLGEPAYSWGTSAIRSLLIPLRDGLQFVVTPSLANARLNAAALYSQAVEQKLYTYPFAALLPGNHASSPSDYFIPDFRSKVRGAFHSTTTEKHDTGGIQAIDNPPSSETPVSRDFQSD